MQTASGVAALGAHTLVSRLVLYASGFVALLLVARELGPAGQGTYVAAMTLGTIAAQVASVGFDQAQAKLWSAARWSREVFHGAAQVVSGVAGVLAGSLVVAVWALGRAGPFDGIGGLAILLVAGVLPLRIYVAMLRGILILDGRLRRVNVALAAGDLARTGSVGGLTLAGALSVEVVLALFWLTMLVPMALMVGQVGVSRGPATRLLAREDVKLGAQLAPYFVFLFLNLRLDVLLLATLDGPHAVGLYAVAVLFAEGVWLVTDSIATGAREQQFVADDGRALDVTGAAVRMSLLVGLLAWPLVVLAGPLAISVLFGAEFDGASDALWALAPAAAAMGGWRAASAAVVRFVNPAAVVRIAAVALVVNVGLNLALIPPLGISGAALASVVAYSIGAALACGALVRTQPIDGRAFLPGVEDARLAFSGLRGARA